MYSFVGSIDRIRFLQISKITYELFQIKKAHAVNS